MMKNILIYTIVITLLIFIWILIIDYVFEETEIGNAMKDKIIQKIKGEKE